MSSTRSAAVAGLFYTADAAQLARQVGDMLQATHHAGRVSPKMLIVPHAGYVYSGAIAAAAYAQLQAQRDRIKRVVLIGPNHRVPLRGIALPSSTGFETPLGRIPLDTQALASIASLPGVGGNDLAHAQEHCLEVQLPFLQCCLADFHLVPLVVGESPPATVAAVLNQLWGGDETLIVVSTDLSHYHPYREAQSIDAGSAHQIETLQAQLLPEQACGAHALNGALLAAKQHGLQIKRLSLHNSGDTAGSRERVVGYGAWALYAAEADDEQRRFTDAARALAQASLRRAVHHQPLPSADDAPPALQQPGACFVTLHKHGQLRGCIGSLQARRPLAQDIIENAAASALHDPRFPPLRLEELDDIALEISLLTPPEAMDCHSLEGLLQALRPGVDGLILDDGMRRTTFLPSVWEQLPTPQQFVAALLRKGGWPADHWSEAMHASRYTAEKI